MTGLVDTTAFDRQLGDLVWMLTTALRSEYSLRQTFGFLAKRAPEPAASALQGWVADLEAGLTYDQAFANLHQAWPSPHLARVIETIRRQRQGGGNLAALLEPVGDEILREVGSDGALYPEMRDLAESVGASLPARAQVRMEP